MDEADILRLLQAVQAGTLKIDVALERLKVLPTKRINDVTHDSHRPLRRGLAEVVYAPGKTDQQLLDAIKASLASGENVIVTRVTQAQADAVRQKMDDKGLAYHPVARILTVIQKPIADLGRGEILIMTAGTADIPVAEEAAVTCLTLGNRVRRAYDVGVAGLHRLLEHLQAIQQASVIVVIAGMEGALPTVVAGLAPCPVIGVPTSIGFGTSFGGIAPLMSMLNSCSGGLTVVNVDGGHGAGVAATLMNRRRPFDELPAADLDEAPPLPGR